MDVTNNPKPAKKARFEIIETEKSTAIINEKDVIIQNLQQQLLEKEAIINAQMLILEQNDQQNNNKNNKVTKQSLILSLYDELYQDEAWWITNQCIPNSLNIKRRPDRMNEFDTHCVIWEIDENQHKTYSEIDAKKRKSELWLACQKPLVILRFNPDQYIDREGHRVPSCFINGVQGLEMNNKKMKYRLEVLNYQVKRCWHFNNIVDFFDMFEHGDAQVHEIYLFYDHDQCLC